MDSASAGRSTSTRWRSKESARLDEVYYRCDDGDVDVARFEILKGGRFCFSCYEEMRELGNFYERYLVDAFQAVLPDLNVGLMHGTKVPLCGVATTTKDLC